MEEKGGGTWAPQNRERLEHPGQQGQRPLPGEKWLIILVPRATVGRGGSDTQKGATPLRGHLVGPMALKTR